MERIGPYEVLGEVARGGMGVVYRARHPDLERPIAIKVLLAGRGATEVARKRFLREAQALGRLEHPHVVRVLDAGEHQGAPFMVQEWVEGESLEERLTRSGPLPLRAAVEVARDLADALAHAHAQGLLHRDLKPGNVLLRSGGGQAVLTDFGLTRALDPDLDQSRLSRTGEFLGTPGFWPPEQAHGQTDRIGPGSDVYGLGATLYAALTGSPPHGEPASLVEALACLDRDPEPPSRLRPDVPPDLDTIVLRCLALTPEQRFATASELREQLSAWLGFRSVAGASRADPPGGGLRPKPRRVAGAIVGAGVLLSGGIALDAVVGRRTAQAPLPRSTRGQALGPQGAAPPGLQPDPGLSGDVQPEAEQAEQRGLARLEAGDPSGAITEFTRAIELRPGFARAYANRGVARLQQGDQVGAVADLTRAIDLRPDDAFAYTDRGEARRQQGDLAGAIEDYTRAIALRPDYALAYFNRGTARRQQGALEGAIEDYSRGLELQPDDTKSYLNRGVARAEQGDQVGAIADITRAIELRPDYALAYLNRAQARAIQADLAGAVEDYTRAIELTPEHGDGYAGRGLLRERQGDLPGAIADYTRALELDPNASWAARVRGRLEQMQRRR